MAEQFILFSSESENEGRSGARTFEVPAVSITAPAPVGEYIAPQTGVEEETLKKVIDILQTIPSRVRVALAEEFEGVVLRVDQLVASEATLGTEESQDQFVTPGATPRTEEFEDVLRWSSSLRRKRSGCTVRDCS